MFVKVDGQPFSLELVSKITDETLLGAYGKEELVETISNFNQKMYTDPATGIYNRRYYEEQLKGLKNIYAVAMLDVDEFKDINDSYGHHAGDYALQAVAKAIAGSVKREDAVIRYGGDEL